MTGCPCAVNPFLPENWSPPLLVAERRKKRAPFEPVIWTPEMLRELESMMERGVSAWKMAIHLGVTRGSLPLGMMELDRRRRGA